MLCSKPSLRTPLGLLIGLLFLLGGCVDLGPTGPSPDARDGVRLNNEIGVQNTFNGYIRIGVVPSVQQLSAGGTAGFVVLDVASGEEVVRGNGEDAIIAFESPPVVETAWWAQVICTTSEDTRDRYLARGEELGYKTFTELAPTGCWRVRVGTWPTMTFSEWTNVIRPLILEQFGISDASRAQMTFAEPARVTITLSGETTLTTLPLRIEPEGGLVRIDGSRYRGVAEVVLNSSGLLAGVNEVYLEDYLYGVVPLELPPGRYGLPEAQKAQAVTARTYALANLGKHRANGYDLLPTTADQVYGGYEAEHPVSTQAVDATRGVVAVSGGVLISTLYHSTSGGYTANSEDVFTNPFSYLRGVPDAERGQAMEHVPTLEVFKRAANPTNLRAAAGGDFEADWSVYHRWVVEWTAAEMAEILSATFNTTVTQVFAINVTDRADHGRVRRIEFVTDAGTLVGLKDQIRSRLQYFTATDTRASLRSTLFFIEPMTDPHTQAIIGWKAYGGGWGHGVGMSQTGAVGMAERGRTYEQILKHYYQGAELETRSY